MLRPIGRSGAPRWMTVAKMAAAAEATSAPPLWPASSAPGESLVYRPQHRNPLTNAQMKYPVILPLSDVLPHLDEFDAIIDVRSPSEFAIDHIPGAISCPVLDDKERAHVGTMYTQVSPFEAKKVGAALIARNIANHIEECFVSKPRDWKPLVYCWRGGDRSGSKAHILAKIGWPAIQLDGGYKAFRTHVNAALHDLPELELRVVCGSTGSGKSRLLGVLKAIGAQVLDLEVLAAHRGSVLGHLPNCPQPSQKSFETSIWDALRHFDLTLPVFIEAESKKVGNLFVPDALIARMHTAACISLKTSREHRVRLLLEDYAHLVQQPELLNGQLNYLVALHGREKISSWQALATAGRMSEVVEALLQDHYDPAYNRSIGYHFSRHGEAIELELSGIDEQAMLLLAARQLHPT